MVERIISEVETSGVAGLVEEARKASRILELNSARHDIRDDLHRKKFGITLGEYWGKHPGFNRALSAAEPAQGDMLRFEWIDACKKVREGVHKEIYGVTESQYRKDLIGVNYATGVFAAANGLDWMADRSLLNGKTG
jgi:hypothetical protein